MILKKLSFVLALVVVMVGLVLPCFAAIVTYQYDDLYRLIKATYSDGTVIEYTYDAAGNRHSVIKIPPAQAPTVSLSADPASIQSGASATLTWSSTNATACTIDQGIGTVNTSGTATVSPTTTTTYTITATNPGGTASASVTITVAPAPLPTVSISANPASVQQGGSSTLSWSSTDATSCSIDQGIGTVAPNGSTPVSPAATTTYTITATGPGGTANATTTVTVLPATEFVVTVATSQGIKLSGVTVYAFTASGSYTGKSATTDGNGQAHFPQQALADGAYKFRVDYQGYQFWSEVVTIPAVSSVAVTIPVEQVEVQVTTSAGPAIGVKVYLFTESGTYLGLNQTTDSAGKVSFDLPIGKNYKFRADVAGSQYWSNVITVIAGGVNQVVVSAGGGRFQITVQKAADMPLAGITAYLFTASGTYLSLSQVTDTSGMAAFTVPAGSYKVRADYLGYQFWSEQTQVSEDTAISLTIPHQQVEVTVTTTSGPATNVKVYLFTESGTYLGLNQTTDSAGKVSFNLPVGKNYKFRADVAGSQYWSNVITVTGEGINTVTINTGG
jgi:YD repeat-containing protein